MRTEEGSFTCTYRRLNDWSQEHWWWWWLWTMNKWTTHVVTGPVSGRGVKDHLAASGVCHKWITVSHQESPLAEGSVLFATELLPDVVELNALLHRLCPNLRNTNKSNRPQTRRGLRNRGRERPAVDSSKLSSSVFIRVQKEDVY